MSVASLGAADDTASAAAAASALAAMSSRASRAASAAGEAARASGGRERGLVLDGARAAHAGRARTRTSAHPAPPSGKVATAGRNLNLFGLATLF